MVCLSVSAFQEAFQYHEVTRDNQKNHADKSILNKNVKNYENEKDIQMNGNSVTSVKKKFEYNFRKQVLMKERAKFLKSK